MFCPVNRKNRLAEVGLYRILEMVKATAGYASHSNITPHALRHACATNLLESGATIKEVQEFLGHSCLTTTAIYLHTSAGRMQSIANLTNLRVKPQQGDTFAVVRMPERRAHERRRFHRIPR
jgi:site-specific recombinase XerD